jgi:hypothetical protein
MIRRIEPSADVVDLRVILVERHQAGLICRRRGRDRRVTPMVRTVIQAACGEQRRGQSPLPLSKHMDNVMMRRRWDTLLHHML